MIPGRTQYLAGVDPSAGASPQGTDLRLADLLAGLSLVTDLAANHPPEQALRACVLATHMANDLGLGREDSSHVYYTSLLRFVGCTAPMPEYAASLGDAEAEIRPRGDMTDLTNPKEAFPFLMSLGSQIPAWRRPVYWATFLARGRLVANREGLAASVGNGDDYDNILEPGEIGRIACVQRQSLGRGRRSDQKVECSLPSRLSPSCGYRRDEATVRSGCRRIERYGLEGRFEALQPILTHCPLDNVVRGMGSSGKFRQSDC